MTIQVAPQFLLDLSDRLREIATPRAVMTAAAELLGRHLGAMRVGYSEMEEDGVHLHIEGDWRAEGVATVTGRHNLEGYGPEIAAAYRGSNCSGTVAPLHWVVSPCFSQSQK